MEYKDFTFNLSDYGDCEKLTGVQAIVYAIKNIILSRPGNFPLSPEIGLDIGQFQFNILDDDELNDIKTKIQRQVTKIIPTIDDVVITVSKVEDIINDELQTALGISVYAMENGEEIEANMLVLKDHEDVNVYSEVNY